MFGQAPRNQEMRICCKLRPAIRKGSCGLGVGPWSTRTVPAGEKLDTVSGVVGCDVMYQPNPEPDIGRETFNNQASELGKSFVLWGLVRPPSTL